MTTGETIALTIWTFVGKVISLLFITLSSFVIAILKRSKSLLISWLQSPCAVIFGAHENEIWYCFHIFPIYLPWVMGPDAMIFIFWMLSFKPAFSLSSLTFLKRLFSSSLARQINKSIVGQKVCSDFSKRYYRKTWTNIFAQSHRHLDGGLFKFLFKC